MKQGNKQTVAIVGAGPWGTYALERLAALTHNNAMPRPLQIVVFEATGNFGDGYVHNANQTFTSQLNRVTSQVAFGADETITNIHLTPQHMRPTLAEWLTDKYSTTNEQRYALGPTEIPSRALHGEALRDMFSKYVERLNEVDGVEVALISERATNLTRLHTGRISIHTSTHKQPAWTVDRVLLTTGHGGGDPNGRLGPYPLRDSVGESTILAGQVVGLQGMGLAAIDVIAELTEGRGGQFHRLPNGELIYRKSGREPRQILPFSRSGLFASARPHNVKAGDPSGRDHEKQEKQPRYLTQDNITTLSNNINQLDFQQHLLPLISMEMADTYYRTLIGSNAEHRIPDLSHQTIEKIQLTTEDDPVSDLYKILDQSYLSVVSDPKSSGARHATALLAELPPHPVHQRKSPKSFTIDWRKLMDPDSAELANEKWATAVRDRMIWDLACARQGNIRNPWKAAWDGVWRDLRGVLAPALQFDSLTPKSREYFVGTIFRTYSREVNGAASESIAKLIALIDAEILDLSLSHQSTTESPIYARNPLQREAIGERPVDSIIVGHLPSPDQIIRDDILYRNLGLAGDSSTGDTYSGKYPRLSLSRKLHPTYGETEWEAVTVLGVPTEGLMFFQLALARAYNTSPVLAVINSWADDLAQSLI